MAKKKSGSVSKRAKGAAKKAGRGVKRAGRKAGGAVRRIARRVGGAVKRGFARVRGKKKSAPKRRRSLPPASGGMVLYTVGADGVAVPAGGMAPASRRGGKGRKSNPGKRGNLANLRGSGGVKGMAMLTLGGAFIVGGALGFELYKQEPVSVPFTEKKIRRSTIVLLLTGAVAVAGRKRYPKVAKHAAALAAGTAIGIGGGYAAAKSSESSL